MNHILKFHQNNNLELKIPNNDGKKVLVKIINIEEGIDQEWGNEVLVVTLKIQNKEDFKYFTDNIFNFFINKEIKQHLSLFSIDKDIVLSFK
jgi:hypothetical protein